MDNDINVKIEYNPRSSGVIIPINQVGPDDPFYIVDKPTYIDIEDTECWFVSADSGSDSDDGSRETPFATLAHAISELTEAKPYIIVLDSAMYNEDISGETFTNFEGLYKDTEDLTPYIIGRVLDYTPGDANTIYVAKYGSDTEGDGTEDDPVKTITAAADLCDATHQTVMILDSEEYTEEGFEFTGNFKNIYAAIGQTPVIKITQNNDFVGSGSFDLAFGERECLEYWATAWPDIPYYQTYYMSSCGLSNGKVLLKSFNSVTELNRVVMLNSDFTFNEYKDVELVVAGPEAIAELLDGKIAIIASNKLKIFTPGLSYLSTKNFPTLGIYPVSASVLANGKIFVVGSTRTTYSESYPTYGKIATINSDYESINSPVSITTDEITSCAGCVFLGSDSNYKIFTVYIKASNGYVYYKIFDLDMVEEVSETLLLGSSERYIVSCASNILGNIFVTIDNNFIILNNDYTTAKALTQFAALVRTSPYFSIVSSSIQSGNFMVLYQKYHSEKYETYFTGIYGAEYYSVLGSIDVVLNGITIEPYDTAYLSNFLKFNGASLTLKYCKVRNAKTSIASNITCWAIYSNDQVDVYNSQIWDCNKGIYQESASADIIESQFCRLALGYALHIKGAAVSEGDITIDHCDFLAVYGGVRFEDNDGTNEIFKNSIVHTAYILALRAEAELTINYSIITGDVSNIVFGDNIVQINPMYINEGSVSPGDTDLNLKTITLGYYNDSPGKGLGESGENVGSMLVQYSDEAIQWDELTFEKPLMGVRRYLVPVGGSSNVVKSGAVKSSVEAWTEYLEFEFTGVLNSELTEFLKMIRSVSNQVRIYLEPDTDPYNYNIYRYIHGRVNTSAKHYKLNRTGVEGFTLKFARAYEELEE